MLIRLILSLFLVSFSLSSFGSHGDKGLFTRISNHSVEEPSANIHQAATPDILNHGDCAEHLSISTDCSSLCAFPSMIDSQNSDKISSHRLEKNFKSYFSIPYSQYPEAPLRPPSFGFSFPS